MSIKNRYTVYFVTIFIITCAISIYSILGIRQISEQVGVQLPQAVINIQKSSKLDIAAQLIRYDDEVLTQSARNYAFTGESRWKDRYNKFVPKLEERINEAISEGTDDEDKLTFSDINNANLALIEIEEKSIAYVDDGKLSKAQEILDGVEYQNQKAIYQDRIEKYLISRGTHLDTAFTTSTKAVEDIESHLHNLVQNQTVLMVGLIIFFIGCLLFLYISITRSFLVPLWLFKVVANNIIQGNLNSVVNYSNDDEIGDFARDFNKMTTSLKDSIENIEVKVKERTLEAESESAKNLALLESIGDGVVATDKNGVVVYVNNEIEKMLGFTKKELISCKWALDVPNVMDKRGNKIPDEMHSTLLAIREQKKITTDYFYQGKDGTSLPVSVVTTPVVVNKELVGTVVIVHDVSKEKQIEKMKDEFISVASHELRTPMTAIKGLSSMILEGDYGEVSDKLRQPIGDIAFSTNRLIHLVSDMLNLSRIEAGRLKFTLKEFDPSDVIKGVVDSLLPIAKQKGLILKLETTSKGIVLGDEDKISQVLNNLIGNSLKFTDRGSIVVDTQIDKNLFKIFVKDTGTGIAKEDIGKIFGKFEQVSSVQKGRPEGTGLGLFISQQIADKLGGDVWLENTDPGKGSVFGFSLPLAGSEQAKKVKTEILKEAGSHPDQKQ